MTQHDAIVLALVSLGGVVEQRGGKSTVVTVSQHASPFLVGKFYVGRMGGLRKGRTKAESISLTDMRVHRELVALGNKMAEKKDGRA